MSWPSETWNRLRGLLTGARADRATQDEIRFHLEMESEKHIRAGVSPAEARRLAAVAFGSRPEAREAARDERGIRWIEEITRDLQYAARQLARTPSFTTVAVATLAIGIGATTAIFSIVNGVLLRPTSVPDPERVAVLWATDRRSGTSREPMAGPDFGDLERDVRGLAASAPVIGVQLNFRPTDGDPLRLSAVLTTGQYFTLMGIGPIRGRVFTAEESRPGGPAVAVLGEGFWRGRLAADPAVIGSEIRLNDSLVTVVGIVPRGADFGLDELHARAAYHAPYVGAGETDVWIPLRASEAESSRDSHSVLAVGRLGPGVSIARLQEELTGLGTTLEARYPQSNTERGFFAEPLEDVVFGPIRPVFRLLLAAVMLVLVVACVNVANLLLARGASRSREVALRATLGADRSRLIRQFLAETGLLALAGGAGGVSLAALVLGGLRALAPSDIPRIGEVAIDGRVLAMTLVVSLLAAVAFGLVPTMQAARLNVGEIVKRDGRSASGSRRQGRFRRGMVVAELALSVTLIVTAGLLVRSFWTLRNVDPGFTAAGILKAEYQLPESRYPRDFTRWPALTEIHNFNAAVLARVRAAPGVTNAAIAGAHPLDAAFTSSFRIEGREAEARDWPEISIRLVSPEYFPTMDLRVAHGRALGSGDETGGPPVAVINQAAADRFFPGRDPIGQEIRFWGTKRRIVGIVANEHFQGLAAPAPIAVYAPLSQAPSNSGVLLVRTSGDPIAVAGSVRDAIRSVDPGLAIYGVERLTETLLGSIAQRRFTMTVLVVFAAITLFLALIGVYGVLNYATTQRTKEIGIRTALGATRGEVAGLVVRNGLRMAAAGVVLGLIGAAFSSRLLTSMLFGIGRFDPVTFVAVPLLLFGAAALATWLPASRASRVEPITALRND